MKLGATELCLVLCEVQIPELKRGKKYAFETNITRDFSVQMSNGTNLQLFPSLVAPHRRNSEQNQESQTFEC